MMQNNPQIARHLEPQERVLWQGQPEPGTFFGSKEIGTAAALVALGAALATGLLDGVVPALAHITGPARHVPALATVGVAALITLRNWRRRAELWTYAITDRRLLSVLGDRIIRSVPPGTIDPSSLQILGKTVFWARSPRDAENNQDVPERMRRGPDHPLIGFHGQSDPQAMLTRILDWRTSFTDRATTQARQFLSEQSAVDNGGAPRATAPLSCGACLHAPSGIRVDLPEGWTVTIHNRKDRPVRLFGVTLIPQITKETDPQPYDPDAEWNVLHASGAPDAGFDLYIREGQLDLTLQKVLDDPWGAVTGLKLLEQTPQLESPGGYHGFALRRMVPGGGSLGAFGTVAGDVVLRQVWLQNGRFVIEAQGLSPVDRPEIAAALDAIIGSLRGAGEH